MSGNILAHTVVIGPNCLSATTRNKLIGCHNILSQRPHVSKHWTYLSELMSPLDYLLDQYPVCVTADYKIEGWGEAAVELQLAEKIKFLGGGLNLNDHNCNHSRNTKVLRTRQYTLLVIVQRLEAASMVVKRKHYATAW